ncbi:MAG: metalloregulator ArsR/SmtB family transcription factor [Verrucomicrobiales bacterium]|nr:metalloregulator ArsR/SmtB family transcription factor [Verrucomicrobiales bacterium]
MEQNRKSHATDSLPAPSREQFEMIAELFKVFADASRLSILHSLKSAPKSVGELVEELDLTQANVSKHLRIMHDARILRREKQGTSVFYSIDDSVIFPLCDLICDKLNRDHQSRPVLDFSI